ncbi:hypothetical protein ACFV2X_41740 [Streptomyces sp. NPDC059679]|uniref:hypothetical protein n=1 Tax=Streptomyces sp. NPDC059679 TaxID=3346903 RepID=UPI0036B9E5C3
MTESEASKRAIGYEKMALGWAKKAQEGRAGAAELAQTFATLAMSARMEHMQWRMRVLGDQFEDVKKSMGSLRRKLPEQ